MKTSIDSIRHSIVHMGTSTGLGVRVMVFNATFNNTSVISCRSVSLVEEIGVPSTCRKSMTNFIT